MTSIKTFTVAGVSTLNGVTKVRFANDNTRGKVLAKNGHVDIEMIDLPQPMTKVEIAKYLQDTEFAAGRPEVEAAVQELVVKASDEPKVSKPRAAKVKDTAPADEVTADPAAEAVLPTVEVPEVKLTVDELMALDEAPF